MIQKENEDPAIKKKPTFLDLIKLSIKKVISPKKINQEKKDDQKT